MSKNNFVNRNETLEYWLEKFKNPNTQYYIKTRVIDQMDWYRSKSKKNKNYFLKISIMSIILTSLVPVFSIVADGHIAIKITIAFLGSSVTGFNSYLAFSSDKELWSNYRRSRELLLSTLYQYFNNAGSFAEEATQEKKDALLITSCESIMAEEVKGWNQATGMK